MICTTCQSITHSTTSCQRNTKQKATPWPGQASKCGVGNKERDAPRTSAQARHESRTEPEPAFHDKGKGIMGAGLQDHVQKTQAEGHRASSAGLTVQNMRTPSREYLQQIMIRMTHGGH